MIVSRQQGCNCHTAPTCEPWQTRIPLLLPLIALGVAGMRVALGEGELRGGEEAAFGLLCYGVATLAIGPPLFAAVWKN